MAKKRSWTTSLTRRSKPTLMRTTAAALLLTLLAGCGGFSLPTPTAAPTVAPSATLVPPTNTPAPPTPTATPVPKLRIGLLDAGELAFGTNLAELLDASAKEFAVLNALPYTALAAPDVTAARGLRVAAGDNVIVLAGDEQGAAVRAAATAHADVTFIYLGQIGRAHV